MFTLENGQLHCRDFCLLYVVCGINMQKHWYGPIIIYDSMSKASLLEVQDSYIVVIPIQNFKDASS